MTAALSRPEAAAAVRRGTDFAVFAATFLRAADRAGVTFAGLLATAEAAVSGYGEQRLRFLVTGAISEEDATADDLAVYRALVKAFPDAARPGAVDVPVAVQAPVVKTAVKAPVAAVQAPVKAEVVQPDRDEMVRFVGVVFGRTPAGGRIAARTFLDGVEASPVDFGEFPWRGDAGRLVDKLWSMVERAATMKQSAVFAPPVCMFKSPERRGERVGATEVEVHYDVAAVVELDKHPAAALAALREQVGEPTLAVASGGEWVDEATGEVEPKAHAYYVWQDPTQGGAEGLRAGRRARELLAALVGDAADRTAIPLSHPIRWAGSLHRKRGPGGEVVARIVEASGLYYDRAEFVAKLERLATERGLEVRDAADRTDATPERLRAANPADAAAALAVIPNEDVTWEAWNRTGMAAWAATAGSVEGYEAFNAWSAKSSKYDPEVTRARWGRYRTSPPDKIGFGALVYEAQRVDPSWSPGGRKREVVDAAYFDDEVGAEGDDVSAPAWVEEMNRAHCVTVEGRNTVVLRRETIVELGGRTAYRAMRPEELTKLHAHHLVPTGETKRRRTQAGVFVEEPVLKPIGAAWFNHPAAWRYLGGVAFLPGRQAPPDQLNLWEGWAIEPAPGSWALLERHIRDVVCSGNARHAEWLLNWIAHMIQKPWERPESAVVLRGGEGSGKGTLGRALLRLAGAHGLHITAPGHLVGRFNAHLRSCLFLFADEAFFAGDRSTEGVLKGLITEPTLMLEQKGVDAIQAPNRLHVLMATNNAWAVPAGRDARRFFVLDVADHVARDAGYFGALNEEMDGGGLAAFLHDMMRRDLSKFDPRNPPQTEALQDQKMASLRGVDGWWYSVLAAAEEVEPDLGANLREWSVDAAKRAVPKSEVYGDYVRYVASAGRREFRPDPETLFWRRLKIMCPALEEKRPGTGPNRQRVVFVPRLEEARAAFERHMGGAPIAWSLDGGEGAGAA
jgi:hypothetical protein